MSAQTLPRETDLTGLGRARHFSPVYLHVSSKIACCEVLRKVTSHRDLRLSVLSVSSSMQLPLLTCHRAGDWIDLSSALAFCHLLPGVLGEITYVLSLLICKMGFKVIPTP